MLLATLVFGVGDLKGKRAFAIVAGALNILTLLVGLQLLKSAGTTWGNDALYLGVYMTINALLLLQLGAYLSDTSRLYGIYKAAAGVLSLVIIAAFGFPGTTEWVSERETALRAGTALVSVTLIVEGALLIYRAQKHGRSKSNS